MMRGKLTRNDVMSNGLMRGNVMKCAFMRKLAGKRLGSMALACLMLASCGMLTGCHGAKEKLAFTIPEEFDTNKQYEVVFWAKNDTNKKQVDIYNQAIADFQEIYPNITVNVRFYTDYSRIYNDVITNISTNTTPNVCITYPDNIATYMTGENVVVPLDELLTDSEYGLGGDKVNFDAPTKSELVESYLGECYLNGHYYAVPYMRSTEACYVNEDMVKALGYELPEILTWDFIWEVSEAAMEKNADGTFKINGQNVMIPFIYKSTDNMMIQYLKQKDADYSTEAGDILLFNEETKGFLEEISGHVATGAFSTFKISSYPANFLNAGQCIFAIDSTAGATWMGTDAPLVDIAEENIVEFHTRVMEIPQVDPQNPQMISQGPSICIFNKEDSGEVLASWLFVQYLLTNDVQIAYASTEGYVPVTEKARNSAEYQDYLAREGEDNELYYEVKIEASKLLLENTQNTFTTPVFNGSASLREASGQLIESTAKSVRRKQTVDDAYFDSLYADTISLYRLDQIATGTEGKSQLGELPTTSRILGICLAVVWAGLIGMYVTNRIKAKRKRK